MKNLTPAGDQGEAKPSPWNGQAIRTKSDSQKAASAVQPIGEQPKDDEHRGRNDHRSHAFGIQSVRAEAGTQHVAEVDADNFFCDP